MERDTRIELVSQPWQGCVIPLYQSRLTNLCLTVSEVYTKDFLIF